jgi:CheY-like chemotaxis protein
MGKKRKQPVRTTTIDDNSLQKLKKRIIWAEDDDFVMEPFFDKLRDEGFDVVVAKDGSETLRLLDKNVPNVDLICVDIMLAPGSLLSAQETYAGRRTGLALARKIREKYHDIPIVACSVSKDEDVVDWFKRYGLGYIQKPSLPSETVDLIKQAVAAGTVHTKPKCFIVHGHDDHALYELKDFLQNTLGFGEPIILRDQPSLGRTIIEKFEEESQGIDLAFVLLTPDDVASTGDESNDTKRRARQNVIFEMGYFLAKFQRRKGRVILLHKGNTDLPSDIAGIVYIDISDGIKQIGELLRKELRDWL